MRKSLARRYLIEVRDAQGSVLFAGRAEWDEKDKRRALAEITRLANLPDVNFYAKPALEPQPAKRAPRRRPAGSADPLT
jgi:hypothetical protein